MEKIKTFHSETFFEILAKNEKELKLNGKFLTDSDNSDSKNPKSKGDFDFSISFDGTSFSFGGENILVGEKSFFKLTKTPTIPERFLETEIDFANILAGIKNRWIEIDSESISNWLREVVKEMPESEGILPEMEKMTEREKEMEEKIKKILEEKLATEKLFLIKRELPDENIRDKKVYHYLLALNQEEFKKLILEIAKIYIDTTFETMLEVYPKTFRPSQEEIEKEKEMAIEELEKNLGKILEKIGEINAQIWIGKRDLLLYKFKTEKEIEIAKLSEGKEKGVISVKAEVNLSKFGEVVEVKEPEEFKAIGEILEEILGPIIKGAQSQTRDAKRMADMRQIRDLMEFYRSIQGQYLSSKTMPTSIKMDSSVVPISQDPGSGPCLYYQWISNIKNPQKFCVFACLENGKFYAVSHKGAKELEEEPKILDCW